MVDRTQKYNTPVDDAEMLAATRFLANSVSPQPVFFSGHDRRRFARFGVEIPAHLRVEGLSSSLHCSLSDIGEGGIAVSAPEPLEIGTNVEVELEVIIPNKIVLGFDIDSLRIDGPSVSHFARLPGIVRRVSLSPDGSCGMGIEFTDDSSSEPLRILGMYIDRLSEEPGRRLW